MSTPQSTPRRASRLGALDTLRLLAAVAVVAFHFTAATGPAWDSPVPDDFAGLKQLTAYGAFGVPLFFVISGFVLLMSAWGRSVPDFVASRVGRLLPAYWVAVSFSIVLVLYLWRANPRFVNITTPDALLNLTMLQEAFGAPHIDGVYWTLWYEARFYFLVALLMLIGMTRTRVLAFATLWPIAGSIASQADSDVLNTLLMPEYAAFFAGGMLIYLIHRDGHSLGTWLLVGVQGLIALHSAVPMYTASITADTGTATSTPRIAAAVFACFALVALTTLTRVASWNARWMSVAGALTYPLYLIHENLGWFTIHLVRESLGPWSAVLVAATLSLLAALGLHYLVERPLGPRLRRATLDMLRPPAERAAATPPRERTDDARPPAAPPAVPSGRQPGTDRPAVLTAAAARRAPEPFPTRRSGVQRPGSGEFAAPVATPGRLRAGAPARVLADGDVLVQPRGSRD